MPKPSLNRASQHEALFLRLTALHKDVSTLATRKGPRDTPEPVRIVAEGLISECAPFRKTRDRLPVAAPDLAGLCVQLGQVLAQLADYERRYTFWDATLDCWCWRLDEGTMPVKRLKPQIKAASEQAGPSGIRDKLTQMIVARGRYAYERGFEAGRVARIGPPVPQGYPEPDASAKNNPPGLPDMASGKASHWGEFRRAGHERRAPMAKQARPRDPPVEGPRPHVRRAPCPSARPFHP